MMNQDQVLYTENASKQHPIIKSQRNELNAYLSWSIRQHQQDGLTRILNARNNAQLLAHHHKTVLHFSCFFFVIFTTYPTL